MQAVNGKDPVEDGDPAGDRVARNPKAPLYRLLLRAHRPSDVFRREPAPEPDTGAPEAGAAAGT